MANSIKLSAAAAIAIAIILAALTWGVGSTHAEDTCETDAAADYLTALGIDAKTSKYDKGAGSPLDYANNGENDESDCDADAAEIVEPTPAPTAAPTPTPRATPEPQTRSAPAPATTPEPGTENTQQQQQQQEDTAITRSSHLPQLSIADAAANNGDDLEFAITLSETSAVSVSFNCATSIEPNDTAVSNEFTSDFTPVDTVITIASGDNSATCDVPTGLSDSFEVVDVTLTVTISNPVNAIIAQATATGTIIDTPLPQLGIQDATAIEGEDLEFTVIFLSDVEVDNVSFTCTTSIESGDTAETNDFTPVDMVISPSGNTATCSVPTARSHGHYELDDTLTVTISNPVNARIYQETATGTIIDTNDFPTLRWLYPSRTVEEDEPTINNFFCLVSEPQTLEGSFGVTLEVTGTATEGEDYNTFDTNVRVSNGQSQLCLPIRIVNDNDLALEDRETVIVRIVSSDASFVRIHANKHTAVLNIDEDTSDATITSLTGGAGHEGGQNNGTSTVSGQQFGNVNFRVRMDKQYFSEQCVDWQIVEGGQAKPGEDVPASGRTIIPPLADDFYIQVPIIDDNLSEQFGSRNYETFELEITGACGGISVPHFIAMGTIYDNEARPTVTIENATAVEGEDIVFVINIWPPAGVRTPVFFGIDAVGHYPPTDDTATKGVDFLAPHPAGFSILLPYGATTAEVRLGTIDDDLVEGTEEFGIGIHRGGSTNVGTPRTATGTILDND